MLFAYCTMLYFSILWWHACCHGARLHTLTYVMQHEATQGGRDGALGIVSDYRPDTMAGHGSAMWWSRSPHLHQGGTARGHPWSVPH